MKIKHIKLNIEKVFEIVEKKICKLIKIKY